MIVAHHCGLNLSEVVVAAGSAEDKDLLKKSMGTYPMLEIDSDTIITDSAAIAAYLCRSSNNSDLLGKTPFTEAQVDQ